MENTLSLTILPNEPEDSELEYLRDYGRNLSPTEAEELAQQWRRVGHSFGLSSGGGRSHDEPRMLVALACALADASDGRVILMNDGLFSLGIGIYTPEQFEHAEWIR
ncbi:hypothetical protein [Paraliomyxa miuraensis]|uniref:hypothetical protein n=1 Tax=Paraliomyxa miuraensis TaxID=376150 RepID=UPI00225765A3|nr:hypothetical protein [Paraliomyxa miuraensis]MCX4239613.1 hypothetical protein [Paraliomyxa miuraensis]